MLRVRLAKGGAKKRPFYWVVVTESSSPRDGRFVEKLGIFNPVARGKEEKLRIDLERLAYWRKVGAQPSERVISLAKQYAKMPQNADAPAAVE